MGFWSGVSDFIGGFDGVRTVAKAVGTVFGGASGQPGQGPVPSLVGQKPNLSKNFFCKTQLRRKLNA